MQGDIGARLRAPRVAVLGPPAIGRAAALRLVTGRAGRLLVALAAAQRPASIDALSEAVWGDDRPATARSALHVHLGTLRRALSEEDASWSITRTGEGYLLDLGGGELDADLAVELVADALDQLAHDPTASLDLVEGALGLWRGAPFAVEGDIVEPSSAHHLEAVRRDAEELLVEALLRTGQAGRAEETAARLVEQEPLREHRWGQLLRARYLGGRTADALAAYRDARAVLVETLGIEPGPELRALEAAALMQDIPGLRLPAPPDVEPEGPPPVTGPFVGRDAELRRVAAALVDRRGSSILGPPGVGKSRLALEAATAAAADTVAWIDLREVDGAAARTLLDWVHRHPDGVVVLDNAEADVARARELMRGLQDHAPAVGLIVTSQVPVTGDLPVEILGPLELPDPDADDGDIEAAPATQVLRAALRDLAPSTSVTAGQASRLVARAGGLPLAIRLSAAAARAISPADLLAQPSSVEGDEIDGATRAVVGLLSAPASTAFADLSVLSGHYDADLGARVCELPIARFLAAMVELVDHGLVQAVTDRLLPYVMLEPIRAVGARSLDRDGRRGEVLGRVADACLERARHLDRAGTDQGRVPLDERLTADLPRYRDALQHLAMVGDAPRALELACRLDASLYSVGWWAEKVDLLDTALSIDGEPSAMRARAHAYRARPGPMHQLDVRHAERAEAMACAIGHDRLAAYSRHVRSIGLWWWGRTSESVDVARDAVEALSDSNQSFEWREACKYLGVAMVQDGDAETGLAMQRDVLGILRDRPGSEFNVAHNLAYLGHCHRFLGDDTAASADWTEARDVCRRVGNRGTAIHVDIGLAEIAVDRDDHIRALERVGEALELARASRAAYYESWAWTVAMRAHDLAGEPDNAITCARRAASCLAGAPPGETVRLAIELASVAVQAGDATAAARLLGVAGSLPDRRELPFPSPAEAARRAATEKVVEGILGPDAAAHTAAGRRCTFAEAAGDLLAT